MLLGRRSKRRPRTGCWISLPINTCAYVAKFESREPMGPSKWAHTVRPNCDIPTKRYVSQGSKPACLDSPVYMGAGEESKVGLCPFNEISSFGN